MSSPWRLRLMTLTETLIISDITKTESNSCFIFNTLCSLRLCVFCLTFYNIVWHCSWKSCIARNFKLVTDPLADNWLRLTVDSQPMTRQMVSTMYNNCDNSTESLFLSPAIFDSSSILLYVGTARTEISACKPKKLFRLLGSTCKISSSLHVGSSLY